MPSCCIKQFAEESRKNSPIFPAPRKEIHDIVRTTEVCTKKQEKFVREIDSEAGIVIFSCSTNLSNEVNEIFMDGTVKSCPRFFSQLLHHTR